MSAILGNINAKRDGYLIKSFALESEKQEDNSCKSGNHLHNKSIDTIETDINSLISSDIVNNGEFFYSDVCRLDTQENKPWLKDGNYFKKVYVSSLALLKMALHARSGGSIEIMGMLTGKIIKNAIVVMDAYGLPVEGTETRVNAQAEGYEYMVQYLDSLKKNGRNENIVGWYHSHPGYGCWLSGIDVATQALNQQFQDPYLAIVVDPERTVKNGKVEIGAFRTYSEEHLKVIQSNKGNSSNSNSYSGKSNGKAKINIPNEKIQDFGLHSDKYYSLEIEIFKSKMDEFILKNIRENYWVDNIIKFENFEFYSERECFEKFIKQNFDGLDLQVKQLEKRIDKNISKDRKLVNFSSFSEVDSISSKETSNLKMNEDVDDVSDMDSLRRRKQDDIDSDVDSEKDESERSPGQSDEDEDEEEEEEEEEDADVDIEDASEDKIDAEQLLKTLHNEPSAMRYLRNVKRNFTGFTSNSPTQPNLDRKYSKDSIFKPPVSKEGEEDKDEAKKMEELLKLGSQASRNLIQLKLQEILFLNDSEDSDD